MSLPHILGYTFLRHDRSNKGGGVAFYVKNALNPQKLDLMKEQKDNYELLSIKVQLGKFKSIIISSFYRPKFDLTKNDITILQNMFLKHLGLKKVSIYARIIIFILRTLILQMLKNL